MKLQTNRHSNSQIRSRPRRPPHRPKLPPEPPLRPLRREALGNRLHRAPPREQADLAVSHPAIMRAPALPALCRAVPRRAKGRRHLQAALHPQPATMGPL